MLTLWTKTQVKLVWMPMMEPRLRTSFDPGACTMSKSAFPTESNEIDSYRVAFIFANISHKNACIVFHFDWTWLDERIAIELPIFAFLIFWILEHGALLVEKWMVHKLGSSTIAGMKDKTFGRHVLIIISLRWGAKSESYEVWRFTVLALSFPTTF